MSISKLDTLYSFNSLHRERGPAKDIFEYRSRSTSVKQNEDVSRGDNTRFTYGSHDYISITIVLNMFCRGQQPPKQ